jgi:hypothetical protein
VWWACAHVVDEVSLLRRLKGHGERQIIWVKRVCASVVLERIKFSPTSLGPGRLSEKGETVLRVSC